MFLHKPKPIKFLTFAFLLLLLLWSDISFCQVTKVVIQTIEIEGAKKTRESAIFRYMNIAEGDSIPLEKLMTKLEENKLLVMNSKLFTDVVLKIVNWEEDKIQLLLHVHEAWYIYPVPIFELADRNFNVWWNEFNKDLSRTNLGLAVYWRNTFGYNDWLKFLVQFGYSRKFELEYSVPAIDKKQRWGFGFNFTYNDNKETSFDTKNNKLLFFRDIGSNQRQLKSLNTGLWINRRLSVRDNLYFGFNYNYQKISDSILFKNVDYFLNGNIKQEYFEISAGYDWNSFDIITYPQKGYSLFFDITKRGLGFGKDVNQLLFSGDVSYYTKLAKRISLGLSASARISALNRKDPYNLQNSIGFEDQIVRGYEYFVVNGKNYFLFKSDLNFKLFQYNVPLFKRSKSSYFKNIPIHVHTRLFTDYGYVQDPYFSDQNPLVNSNMIGYGIGLDFAMYYYNIIFKLEYAVNKMMGRDIYFKFGANF